MADGNELDDDITSESVVYETGVLGQQSFVLPPHGFNTDVQKQWADRVAKEILLNKKDNRVALSQSENANRLANDTSNTVSTIIYPESEENFEVLERPSAPASKVRLGTIEVTWDGLDFEGTPMGSGFANLSVYAVKTEDIPEGADFNLREPFSEGDVEEEVDPGDDPTEPGEPADPEEGEEDGPVAPKDPATVWPPRSLGSIAESSNGGNVILTNLEYNKEYTIWTIASDVRGNTTDASDRITQTVVPLVDTDIIGRVLDGNNIILESLNKELLDEGLAGELADLEAAASRRSMLLRNFSFEVDDDAWSYRWVGLEAYPTVRKEVPDAKEGSWVLSNTGIVGEFSVAAQKVNAYPGDFQARFFYRSTRTHANAFYVTCVGVDSTGITVGNYGAWFPQAPASSWTEGVADFKIPADTDPNLTFILVFQVVDAEVDDVSLFDVSPVRARNGNIYSENPPSGTGDGPGSTWFQWDSDKNVIGMWSWVDPVWEPMELRDEVIGNLSAGKINTGYLSADRIEFNSLSGNKITVNTLSGDRVITNSLNADKIVANSITGDKIAALTIEAGELAANSITADKIDVGAITGSLIEGKVIATALTGQRTQLDVNGLRTFNSSNAQTSMLSAASGGMNLSGKMIVSGEVEVPGPGTLNTTLKAGKIEFRAGGTPVETLTMNGDAGFLTLSRSGNSGMALIDGRGATFMHGGSNAPSISIGTDSSSVTSLSSVGGGSHTTLKISSTSYVAMISQKSPIVLDGSDIVLNTGSVNSNRGLNVLYSTSGSYMGANHTANLSQTISSQLTGIVLAWCWYVDGAAANHTWNFHFIPKTYASGSSTSLALFSATGRERVPKIVYTYNNRLTGHANNSSSTAGANFFVLRHVYGV